MIISIKGTTFLDVLVRNLPYKFTFTAFIYSCFGVCLPLLWSCRALALCYVSPQSGPSAAFSWPLFPVPLALLQPCFSPAAFLETIVRVSFCFFFLGGMISAKEIQQR